MENGLIMGILVFMLIIGLGIIYQNLNKNNKKPQNIDDIIASDPQLAKIDKELGDINRKAGERIKNSPRLRKMFKDAGLDY